MTWPSIPGLVLGRLHKTDASPHVLLVATGILALRLGNSSPEKQRELVRALVAPLTRRRGPGPIPPPAPFTTLPAVLPRPALPPMHPMRNRCVISTTFRCSCCSLKTTPRSSCTCCSGDLPSSRTRRNQVSASKAMSVVANNCSSCMGLSDTLQAFKLGIGMG